MGKLVIGQWGCAVIGDSLITNNVGEAQLTTELGNAAALVGCCCIFNL